MKRQVRKIISDAQEIGWVLEPQAKDLMKSYGLTTSKFVWARTKEAALQGAEKIGYPLVAKIVSPKIIHKSDVGGVIVGVRDQKQLGEVFAGMSKISGFEGILLDEMLTGAEVIFGAKDDPQFGTVVMAGIGGTSVEVYKDVALRMAPVNEDVAGEALRSLRGIKLLQGYRGSKPVDLVELAQTLVKFSRLAYDLKGVADSIDLNPLMCSGDKIIVADARIILKTGRGGID